jgi:hypothetical protein
VPVSIKAKFEFSVKPKPPRVDVNDLFRDMIPCYVLALQRVISRSDLSCPSSTEGDVLCLSRGAYDGDRFEVHVELLIPGMEVPRQVLSDSIIPKLMKQLHVDNVLARLREQPKGSWEDIFVYLPDGNAKWDSHRWKDWGAFVLVNDMPVLVGYKEDTSAADAASFEARRAHGEGCVDRGYLAYCADFRPFAWQRQPEENMVESAAKIPKQPRAAEVPPQAAVASAPQTAAVASAPQPAAEPERQWPKLTVKEILRLLSLIYPSAEGKVRSDAAAAAYGAALESGPDLIPDVLDGIKKWLEGGGEKAFIENGLDLICPPDPTVFTGERTAKLLRALAKKANKEEYRRVTQAISKRVCKEKAKNARRTLLPEEISEVEPITVQNSRTVAIRLPRGERLDDERIARYFVAVYGADKILVDAEALWLYSEENGRWTYAPFEVERIVSSLRLVFCQEQQNDDGEWKDTVVAEDCTTNVRKRANLIKMLASVAPVRTGMLQTKRSSDARKLLFTDCYFDFASGQAQAFDPELYFTCGVSRPFAMYIPLGEDSNAFGVSWPVPPEVPAVGKKPAKEWPRFTREQIEERKRYILEHSFHDMADDSASVFKHGVMRGFIGDSTIRVALIMVGGRLSGKGSFVDLLTNAMAGATATFNADELIERKTFDPERSMGFAIPILGKRFGISQEMNSGSGGKAPEIDIHKFKNLVSDGDSINARQAFKLGGCGPNKSMLIFATNPGCIPKLPENADPAMIERLKVLTYLYSYVDEPKNPDERPRDTEVKRKYSEPLSAVAFFWLMVDVYREWMAAGGNELKTSEAAVARRNTAFGLNEVADAIALEFEVTKNPNDQVPFSDFEDYVRACGFEVSKTKLGKILADMGTKGKPARTDKGVVQVRTGIRRKAIFKQ